MKWYEASSKRGLADGTYNLAIMYSKGEGVKQDYEPIRRWYESHLGICDVSSYLGLAELFEAGRGVPVDEARAFSLYRTAAEECTNTPQADERLAAMYEQGLGTPQDLPRADVDGYCSHFPPKSRPFLQ